MGVELVRAGAGLFLEAADALWAGVTLERWDDAREAHMARRLAQLLAEVKRSFGWAVCCIGPGWSGELTEAISTHQASI